MSRSLRVAWFSPIAALDSTSSYVSAQLLPRFDSWQIDVFTEGGSEAISRHEEEPYDLFFYQIEDSPCSEFARAHHMRMPGVVWFHDFYRRPSDAHAPHFIEEVSSAQIALFSNERDMEEAQRMSNGKLVRCHYVPCPISFDPAGSNSTNSSSSAEKLRIGFCGGPELEFRAAHVLAAIRELEVPAQLCWLCASDEKDDAVRLGAEFGVELELHEERSPQRWQELVPNCQLAFHGLFSAYGSPSPYLQISMMARVPVLVSDFSEAAALPKEAVCMLPLGQEETPELVNALRRFVNEEERRRQAERGYQYAQEVHRVAAVVKDLQAVL